MKLLKYIGLLSILLFSVAVVNAQDTKAPAVITLERTACFGTCPVYTVSIAADGTVTYMGQDFVTVKGEQTSQIDPATVEAMVKAFEEAGFFDWDETYTDQSITDQPYMTISVTRNGETHTINHYAGDFSAPLLLSFLEQWVDKMVNTALWTGVQPDSSVNSNGTDIPVLTLHHTECFGNCPVYDVAIYADGTVVYTGVANVDHIGVRVLKTDESMVQSTAQLGQIFDYFSWQDAYDQHIKTDQATTITSIRWEDEYKRIARYEGDPNAPVGLLWIESSIDQLVTNAK